MSFEKRLADIIRKIPRGKVATYSQIAALSGSGQSARTVGRFLHEQAESLDLPWQRVVNKTGRISVKCLEHPAHLQAELLRRDGVEVVKKGCQLTVDLKKYLWKPSADNLISQFFTNQHTLI